MPRYFFNVKDHDFIIDKTGIELSGLAEARWQARELVEIGKRLLPGISFLSLSPTKQTRPFSKSKYKMDRLHSPAAITSSIERATM
jgi:hypothetical protein